MDARLEAACALLTENSDQIRRQFKWDYDILSIAAAMVFTAAGRTADAEHMKACRKLLKHAKGVFSDFRGATELAVISKMALAPDPEGYLASLTAVYDRLHEGRLFGSAYLVLAAINICDLGAGARTDEIIGRTKTLMTRMKQLHPFLTSDSDMAFAALLAMRDKEIDVIVEEMEAMYQTMKQKFSFHSNAVQSLSQVMAVVSGAPEKKCAQTAAIYDALKARKVRYGKEYELAALGALAGIEASADAIAEDLIDAAAFLKGHKGFGNFTLGSTRRLMFAALLSAGVRAADSQTVSAGAVSSAVSIAIAQEITMLIAMTAAANSANAAAASSH